MKRSDDEIKAAASHYAKEGKYWLTKFSGEFLKSSFPKDIKIESKEEYNIKILRDKFPGVVYELLMKLRNGSDYRLFMILAAGIAALLGKYTGNNDITLGCPIYRQEQEGEAEFSNTFINTVLPLRIQLENNISFKDLLLQVRQTIVDADTHQNYPMETLLYKLGIPMSEYDFPLFDVALVLENVHERNYLHPIKPGIIFSFLRTESNIEVSIEYDEASYFNSTITRIAAHFSGLMQKMLENINNSLSRIDILSEQERNQLLYEFNDMAAEFISDKTIQQLFEEQVKRTPGNIALHMIDGTHMTYGELNRRANLLGGYLREKGISPDSIVGIMVNPSFDMVVGMLGILKAGGAYLPIDPNAPLERIITMLKDSGARMLLSGNRVNAQYPFTALQGLKEKPAAPYYTPQRKQIVHLDSLPFPNRAMVNYEKYNRLIGQVMVTDIISLQTARGCPYECAFCSKVWHKKHVFRSAEHIFAELMVYYNMGVRRFSIFDDIFNINAENGKKFFNLIIENKLDIQLFFPNGMRGDLLTKEYIDLAVQAGLVATALALETASPRLQKMIKKNLNLVKFRENVEYFCEKYPHVILELFAIHGFPTETEEEAFMTLDFIKSLKWVHFPYLFILKIYPDTPLEKLALDNGVHREDILKCEDLALHEMSPTSPFKESFTKKFQSEFLNEYFLSKERLLHVLPHQLNVFTKDELIQKYDSYLPGDITSFEDLLAYTGITEGELDFHGFVANDTFIVPEFNQRLRDYFPVTPPDKGALRVLFLDLSQHFSEYAALLYDVVEPPLGALYIMTYLDQQLGNRVQGKIAKSRIDFDSFEELKTLLADFKPDVIALRTLTIYRDFFHTTVQVIRQWGIHVPIIAGGPYATRNPATLLQDSNIDLVVLLEGELTFCEIIEKIIENNGKLPDDDILKEIAGIVFVPGKNAGRGKFARELILMDQLEATLLQKSGNERNEKSENPASLNQSSDAAYVIYTSGSTGLPKGVLVEHRNAVNVLLWYGKTYNLQSGARVMQLTNYIFDPSVEQIFGSLLHGAEVYIGDKNLLAQADRFHSFLEENRINILNFVPGVLVELLNHGKKPTDLRALISGGERLDEPVKNNLIAAGYRLYNQYGPTETTIDALMDECSLEEAVTLGRPIANVQCYVMDKDGNLLPIGVAGELIIMGAGVTRGYLNNPELTAEKFRPLIPQMALMPLIKNKNRALRANFQHSAFSIQHSNLYCTGDLARWLPQGKIEFLGRIDHQIKIKGYRVELGEIESRLKAHRDIKDAVVTVMEDEDRNKFLCAYYTSNTIKKPELMPSVGDYCLWDDLLYYAMANDRLKNNSYKIAIDRMVKGKTVVEVGTGKDMILAKMAVEAGAKKVYAIEIQEEYYLEAKKKLQQLRLEDKIELILGDSRDVELPEKVDVNVTNQIGSIGSSEGAIVLHNDARRFLKEKHYIIPHHCITKIAAVTLPDKLREKPTFSLTSRDYTEKIFNKFGYPFDLRLCIQNLPKGNIISDDGIFEDVDFQNIIPDDSRLNIHLTINRKGKLDGFILWINFYTVPDHMVDTIAREHIWKPVFMPAFEPPQEVEEGDVIEADCIRTLGKNNLSPDYKIEGFIIKKNGRQIPFQYDMPYMHEIYKGTPLFQKLFSNESAEMVEDPENALTEDDLRHYLEMTLPEYMIPSHFVALKALPLTSTGKIDRSALADPAMMSINQEKQFISPQNEIEKKIMEVWAGVLGKKEISVNENFFTIGGDSIKAIQIVARMNREGFKIKTRDIFRNPTIAALAPLVSQGDMETTDQSIVTGSMHLTPGQKEFFELADIDPHYYNQAVMLYTAKKLSRDNLGTIFTRLQEHHDALRITFKKDEYRRIKQTNHSSDYPLSLTEYDLTNCRNKEEALDDLTRKANQVQASIDLENGPLMKIALFHLGDGDRLLIVIHHLVVDAVSWRILLEDISTLYRQLEAGKELVLPQKTNSFKQWTEMLAKYAKSESLQKEKNYWAHLESLPVSLITKDYETSDNYLKDAEQQKFRLSKEETQQLLTKVNHAFGTEINDILLTALGLAVRDIYGQQRLLIAMEGHGREDIESMGGTGGNIDVSRTVGWFTSIYPILLEISHPSDLSRQVKEIKEQLRTVPNKGIGYGILKYLSTASFKNGNEFKRTPQISFNYLGQFDADVEKMDFRIAEEFPGYSQSLERHREYELDVGGWVVNHQLELAITYNKKQFKFETIQQLLQVFKVKLEEIIDFCSSRSENELTPSDLTYDQLSIDAVENINALFNQ